MRPAIIVCICGLLAAAPHVPAASAAEGDSLFRQLQQKGSAPAGATRHGGTPSNRFVENMRAKGIEPIQKDAGPQHPARTGLAADPALGPAGREPRPAGTPDGRTQALRPGQQTPQAQQTPMTPKAQQARPAQTSQPVRSAPSSGNTPDLPAGTGASKPGGGFDGRVVSDGRGGYRTLDATGRHTKTLTPDGRGGYRIYDAAGTFQGRVNVK